MKHATISTRLRTALGARTDRRTFIPYPDGTLRQRTVQLVALSPLTPGYAEFNLTSLHPMGRAKHVATLARLTAPRNVDVPMGYNTFYVMTSQGTDLHFGKSESDQPLTLEKLTWLRDSLYADRWAYALR